ncbi:MAG: hypothetical protein AAGA54_35640 [Myxococcota bacterium]
MFGGVAVGSGGVVTGAPWTEALLRRRAVWLNAEHPVVSRALAAYVGRPKIAAYGLAVAVLGRMEPRPELEALVERWRSFT